MSKVEITKDTKVLPGDELEFHYDVSPGLWLKAVQMAMIETRLEKEKRFRIEGYEFQGDYDRDLVIRIRVITPPKDEPPEVQEAGVPVAYIILAIAAAASALFVWLSLGKMYKITSSGTGTVVSIGAVAIILLILLGRRK